MKNYTKQEILKIILSVAKEYDEKLNDKHFKITNIMSYEDCFKVENILDYGLLK